MRSNVDQVTTVNNDSQSEDIDRWNRQPEWSKVLFKVWITLELGWYVGWIVHMLHYL